MWVITSRHKIVFTYFRSLKFRILLVLLAVSWVPMILMSASILKSYQDRAIAARSTEVQNQCMILSNQLLSYNYMEDPSTELIDGELAQLSSLYDGRIIIIDQDFRVIKDTYGLIENKYVVSEEVIRCFKGETTNQLSEKRFIEMTVPVRAGDSNKVQGVLLVSVSTDSIWDSLDALTNNAWVFTLVYGILVTVAAILLSHLLVQPICRIIAGLHEISSGHSNEDLMVKTYAETVQVSEEFNKIVTQMRALDESRQEFVSNVSHELKTPLTSMKVLADSLLTQEEVPNELYKEFMGDIAEEIERENKIITDLLALVKMDKKAASLNIEKKDINDLLELILKRLRPIAAKKNIEVVLESFRPVTAEVDESRLTLAFTNLVENAIKYNKENGWVHVSLDADHKFFYVKVMDSGQGIPEESLDYIFERFYRVDKSHSSEIDGTGLGLAIAKSAVLVHKGAIKVSSELGVGTTFSVRIPLNYIA
ncbi:sensor histidine kinase [Laedolimicola ammoniilytica]|uniref:histidine kinase n=1 Tax=Laedolimicola ammoniilytica TaxID=2981771 RepID=A0ABT2RYG9_9FIRM|nr:ATP-binding protein [Laedolimicola ammoniilytica]MCU6697379.1 ATP-binding protein [Laedolimicola ammoniilytica]SCG91744.1 Alkaline phosphatase synthesis sensor protein phoR [uncultured Clostridium sp.]SCI23516.1 Alkaline phosphatase synthesis sensor protein phoR [uncultured Clostridium sp.]